MWESQVLLTDCQVVFLRVLRFSPTFDERSARYKWNILERAVKPKSKKKKKKLTLMVFWKDCFEKVNLKKKKKKNPQMTRKHGKWPSMQSVKDQSIINTIGPGHEKRVCMRYTDSKGQDPPSVQVRHLLSAYKTVGFCRTYWLTAKTPIRLDLQADLGLCFGAPFIWCIT